MTPEQHLYFTMVDAGMKINPGTLASLKEAIEQGNIHFFEEDGKAIGFVTWFLDNGVLEVNNLCINIKGKPVRLFALRKMLHEKYPNLSKVRWHDDSKERNIEYGFVKNESNIRPVSRTENSRG